MTLFYADEVAEARQLADVVDLFAGPGGWSIALHRLGLADIGIEFERWACATRRAAELPTVEADVSHLDPLDFAGARGLIASPPCQGFSSAGLGKARDLIPELVDAIRARDWTARPDPDPKVWLVLEVGRWIEALAPEWIALEQVPAVLPLWAEYSSFLRQLGYSTWTGTLNAADYGVPQTRRRAILIASRTRTIEHPPPTHSADGAAGTLPWVTMADALGWPESFRLGFPRLDDRGDSADGYRERDWRSADEPSFTLTEKARSWSVNTGMDWKPGTRRNMDEPAPTLAFGHAAADWIFERPATTVLGDSRLWPPGHKVNADDIERLGEDEARARYGDRAGTEAIRLDIVDALRLQSFPATYPVRGTKTRQFEQIGNAVPPVLAEAVLRTVLGL